MDFQPTHDQINNNNSELEYKIQILEERVDQLEKMTHTFNDIKNRDSFVTNIINKIGILKEKIKKDMPTDDLFSYNLTMVEKIESEIFSTNKVTKDHLTQLNKIHSSLKK